MRPNEEEQHDHFLRLFAVSEPALRAFVRSLAPRRDDVPEVMQEVAVVLWRKFGDLADPGDFRKWAFGVARLEALAWAPDKARDRHANWKLVCRITNMVVLLPFGTGPSGAYMRHPR